MSRHIDEHRPEACELSAALYRQAAFYRKFAPACTADIELFEAAAALLDTYQAGLTLVTPHPAIRAELVLWHRAAANCLPVDDESVILHLDTQIDPVIEGLWTEGTWHTIDGTPIYAPVLHWARITGPAPDKATALKSAGELAA